MSRSGNMLDCLNYYHLYTLLQIVIKSAIKILEYYPLILPNLSIMSCLNKNGDVLKQECWKNPALQSFFFPFLSSHNDFLQSIVILAYMFSSLTSNFKVIKRIKTNLVTSPTLANVQSFIWAHMNYNKNPNQYINSITKKFCRMPFVTL